MDEILAGFIAVVVLVGGVFLVTNHLQESSCRNNVSEMGREYRYDWVNGCRIGLDDGTFIYWEMYREFGN